MNQCNSATEIMRYVASRHRLNVELELQSLFRLLCTGDSLFSLADPRNSLSPPAVGLIYEVAIGQPRETTYLCKTHGSRTRSTEQKDRVKEEIGIMRRLANPNVIKFIDAFENSREIILGKSLPIIYLALKVSQFIVSVL
jgi:hypothetical protein